MVRLLNFFYDQNGQYNTAYDFIKCIVHLTKHKIKRSGRTRKIRTAKIEILLKMQN